MNLIKPKKLQKGDTIAIIATSGEVNIEKIYKAKYFIESLGYSVKLGSNITKKLHYLAGTDKERIEDLHNAFSDEDVKSIICARGGYGAIRLINQINYDLIKNNPKIICGYSDISALLTMITKRTGLVTFLGPMAQSDFAENIIDEYTLNSFFDIFTLNEITINKSNNSPTFNPRNCEGVLFGGNLATIASLCGQDFIPDEKFLFIAEDLNESTYKLDKYFTQLFNIEKFKNNINGIILGDFLELDDIESFKHVLKEISQTHNIPVIGTYPITHSKTKATIPLGTVAKIENETIKIKDFMV